MTLQEVQKSKPQKESSAYTFVFISVQYFAKEFILALGIIRSKSSIKINYQYPKTVSIFKLLK